MIAVAVLAAGSSERMGRLKQLLPWGRATLLEHAVDVALASAGDEVLVVLGYQADVLRPVLADRPVRLVVNQEWVTGLASSVQAALAAVPNAEAVVFLPVDQPQVTPGLIDQVIATFRAIGRPIVVPRCGDRRGPPTLFAQSMFPALSALTGDEGGRAVIEAHMKKVAWVDLEEAGWLADVDTLADYEHLRRAGPRA